MPRLLLMAPCDNVLLSGEQQSASLITVLTQIVFPPGLPSPLPENTFLPLRWFIFSQWELTNDEFKETFNQKATLSSSDGKELLSSMLPMIPVAARPIHRMVIQNNTFPLVPPGTYRIKISLQIQGRDEWEEKGDYPITVIETPVQAEEELQESNEVLSK